MKPNDKAYQAAIKIYNIHSDYDAESVSLRLAVDAAYAAQFPPSEDYAGLITELRMGWATKEKNNRAADAIEMLLAKLNNKPKPSEDYAELIETLRSSSPYTLSHVAADAIEAVLAERDALKDELALRDACKNGDGQFTLENTFQSLLDMIDLNVETSHEKIAAIEERDAAIKERDELLARLAPVDDDALVEIAARGICLERAAPACCCKNDGVCKASVENLRDHNAVWLQARAAIAAIRPHIEAAEREQCVKAVITVAKKINVAPHERPAYEDGYLQGVHDAAAAIRREK